MSDEFLSQLRAEIVDAAGRETARRRRRRGMRRATGFAAVIAVVFSGVVIATSVVSVPPAAAEVVVTREGDELVVRLVGDDIEPTEVVAALRAVGVEVSVTQEPVGPSNVDKFLSVEISGEYPLELRVVDGDEKVSFAGFAIPAGYSGELNLVLGRAAAPGEVWVAGSAVNAPGEILECVDVSEMSLGQMRSKLGDAVSVQVIVLGADATVTVVEPGGDAAAFNDWAVVRAMSVATNEVSVEVSDEPQRYLDLMDLASPDC